jgi:hypothetical protein
MTDTGSGLGAGAQMQFSTVQGSWGPTEAYATTKTLTVPVGTAYVYAQFKDVAGNLSATYSVKVTP